MPAHTTAVKPDSSRYTLCRRRPRRRWSMTSCNRTEYARPCSREHRINSRHCFLSCRPGRRCSLMNATSIGPESFTRHSSATILRRSPAPPRKKTIKSQNNWPRLQCLILKSEPRCRDRSRSPADTDSSRASIQCDLTGAVDFHHFREQSAV